MTSSWLLGTWRRDTTMTSNWKRVGHLAYCCDNSKKSKRFKSASCLFIPCPPAIWRKTSVGTWTSPTSFKFHINSSKVTFMLKPVEFCWNFPNGKSAQGDVSLQQYWALALGGYHPTISPFEPTNGWNLKIHPQGKRRNINNTNSTIFFVLPAVRVQKLVGLFSFIFWVVYFSGSSQPFPAPFLGKSYLCFQVTVLSRGRLMLLVPGQCSLPFWSETWKIII